MNVLPGMLVVLLCLGVEAFGSCADLIVFSYNRPLQLHAYLESLEQGVSGLEKTVVLWRASDSAFKRGYALLAKLYPTVLFHEQHHAHAPTNFKPLLQKAVNEICQQQYLLFGVDDMVVSGTIDLEVCVQALQSSDALGFYLRLGRNIVSCYQSVETEHKVLPCPPLKPLGDGINRWRFGGVPFSWRFPHSVDMTVFRRSYVCEAVNKLDYQSPNTFEKMWSKQKPSSSYGLCFDQSKVVNIPINCVQKDFRQRHMGAFSVEQLQEIFDAGMKIDIKPLQGVNNKSAHITYAPNFVHDARLKAALSQA